MLMKLKGLDYYIYIYYTKEGKGRNIYMSNMSVKNVGEFTFLSKIFRFINISLRT